MEATSLILTAVVAGDSKAETPSLQSSVEDAFASLHVALRAGLAGEPADEAALEEYIAHPEHDRDELIEAMVRTGAVSDPEVLRLAAAVMKQIDPEGAANGNYAL